MLGRGNFFSQLLAKENDSKRVLPAIVSTVVSRRELVVEPSSRLINRSKKRLKPLLETKKSIEQKTAATQTENLFINKEQKYSNVFDPIEEQDMLLIEKRFDEIELAERKKAIEKIFTELSSSRDASGTSLQNALGSLQSISSAYSKESGASLESQAEIQPEILPNLKIIKQQILDLHGRTKEANGQRAVARAVAETKLFYNKEMSRQYETITSEYAAQSMQSLQKEQQNRKEERVTLIKEIDFLKNELRKVKAAALQVSISEKEAVPTSTSAAEDSKVEGLQEECIHLRNLLDKERATIAITKSALINAEAREKLSHDALMRERAVYSEERKEENAQRLAESKRVESARDQLIAEIYSALEKEAHNGLQVSLIESIIRRFETERRVVNEAHADLLRKICDASSKREKRLIELLDFKIGLIKDGFIHKEINPVTLGILNDEILRLQAIASKARVEGILHGRLEAINNIKQISAGSVSLASQESAPTGVVTLVFTDVQDSTMLWDKARDDMKLALTIHNSLMRTKIRQYNGYEVKTEGDAFMISFKDPNNAVQWAIDMQKTLCANDSWPASLARVSDSCKIEIDTQGTTIWNGLRVRMGIHIGNPIYQFDKVSNRMDYYGPMVNLSARISGSAKGGQILVSSDLLDVIKETNNSKILASMKMRFLGSKEFKGIATPQKVWEILPVELANRSMQFP